MRYINRLFTYLLTHHSIFTGQVLFVTPNEQCQSTEGRYTQCWYRNRKILGRFFSAWPRNGAVCCSRIWLKECRAAKRDCTGRNRWMKLCRFWNSLECFERFDICWLCYSSICVCIFQTMSFSQNYSNQGNRWMENSWLHLWLPNLCYSRQITFSVRSI